MYTYSTVATTTVLLYGAPVLRMPTSNYTAARSAWRPAKQRHRRSNRALALPSPRSRCRRALVACSDSTARRRAYLHQTTRPRVSQHSSRARKYRPQRYSCCGCGLAYRSRISIRRASAASIPPPDATSPLRMAMSWDRTANASGDLSAWQQVASSYRVNGLPSAVHARSVARTPEVPAIWSS